MCVDEAVMVKDSGEESREICIGNKDIQHAGCGYWFCVRAAY